MTRVPPRELHFSYNNTQFTAIFVDNRHGCSVSNEPCCICGDELNNLAFYAIEPRLFYAHVACALNPHHELPSILPHLPLNIDHDVQVRGILPPSFSNSFYSSSNYYAPNYAHHAYYFPNNNDHYHHNQANSHGSYGSGVSMQNVLGAVAKCVLGAFLQALFAAIL